VIAAKIGLRSTVLTGAILESTFSLLVPVFSNPYAIASLRVGAGVGMALVYAPGMMLAIRYVKEGRQSMGIALYSAVGDLGGIAGLFGWAVLGARLGWRSSVALSGALGLAFALALLVLLARDERSRPTFAVRGSDLRRVLLGRDILLLSLALLGMECGWNVVAYFMVFYLETHLAAGAGLSGLVGGFLLIAAIVGALIISRFYERLSYSRFTVLLIGIACASSVSLVSTGTFYGAISATILEGVLNGAAFTFVLVLTRKITPIAEYEALGVAWVNEIAIFGSFWSTLLFSQLVTETGYPLAWTTSSLVGIFFILPVLLIGRRTPAASSPSTSVLPEPT
jgi:MFS family permease